LLLYTILQIWAYKVVRIVKTQQARTVKREVVKLVPREELPYKQAHMSFAFLAGCAIPDSC